MKPPKFYDNQYEIIEPERMEQLREKRKLEAEKNEQTKKRLKTLENIQEMKYTKLKRGYENG